MHDWAKQKKISHIQRVVFLLCLKSRKIKVFYIPERSTVDGVFIEENNHRGNTAYKKHYEEEGVIKIVWTRSSEDSFLGNIAD